ncbi:iron-containing alcohol dehydrogenase [Propionivibrio sp.]|uniref:iron-containing alcohol dehydrogenase n=1 Tax=Propionivibrio sp. TaxID=2212460 RepID=UPI00272E7FC6|nr:iron-containing alcohol dehydrogenase [Propionivibrio sp.]
MQFNHYMPSRIFFGAGALDQLGNVPLPGKKALIVISAGKSMRQNGYLDRLIALLKKNGAESVVFDKIQPNPIKSHVMEAAELARQSGCDFVIGLGGGSSIDSAKSIAMMAKNPGDYWDYIGGGSGQGKPVLNGALPIIAITTTAGTGTEADPWTVITKEETNEKIGYGNDHTFPLVSIVDPELMLSVPPHLTAYQGMDAFFHAAEGVIATCASPMSDLYALKSIETIARWLPVAVKDGSNKEARAQMAFANMLSGFVESTSSCTSEHSLEHALSAYHPDLPHGAGLTILSVAYFGFFLDKIPGHLFESMARAMGENVDALPANERPAAFITALKKLIAGSGLEGLKMSDYGIRREEIPTLAQNARDTMGGLFELDRHKLSLEETKQILENAYR